MLRHINRLPVRCVHLARSCSSGKKPDRFMNEYKPPPMENPIKRTLRILGDDMRTVKRFFVPENSKSDQKQIPDPTEADIDDDNQNLKKVLNPYRNDGMFQTHCDVLVIGGGGIGSSIAFWLKHRMREGLNVVVLEKDNTYKSASTVLSVGGLRQQFSLEENIQMSLFGADFIRNVKEYLGEDVELNFTPHGYLLLASEQGADQLIKNSALQNTLGAKNELLTAEKLKSRFPWLNTKDISIGCHGLEKEGWFDPWALLCGLSNRAKQLGANYTNAELVGFEYRDQPDMIIQGGGPNYKALDKAIVKMPNGEIKTIKFGICIIAAGAKSGEIARLANIGVGSGLCSMPLPVEPRKRYVYVFKTQGEHCPGLNTPLTIDPTNTYFRRDGIAGNFLAGRSPSLEEEPTVDNLDVDYNYFDTHVWPQLAERVPAFESIKVQSAWAGFYEYNTFDENGIIGPHPAYHNLIIATGFSGHGIQQAPAVGRAVSEIIIEGNYKAIDLSRLGFDRIVVDKPMYEVNIV